MNPLAQSKNTTILPVLIALTLGCFGLSPQARAVCQEGCDTVNFNTFLGDDALISNTTGVGNTATGFKALSSNTTGDTNTATGYQALFSNTIGSANTATGEDALSSNTQGALNTATGSFALWFNTTGWGNTATGDYALAFNTTGVVNTATGIAALQSNTSGYNNTATGSSALGCNTTGYNNTATGLDALTRNTTGFENTANGAFALAVNTTGESNTANGLGALVNNTNGSNNTANGADALRSNKHGSNNTCVGNNSLYQCRGSNNTAFGTAAGIKIFSGNNNICISNEGARTESNTIRIGNETHTDTFIAGISGTTVPTGVAVIVDADGHLGTTTSSARFKDAIKPMDKTSEAILALNPVTFRYKHELDPAGIPQFGLVAEEVAEVDRDLVTVDKQGKPETVRYEAVNAMLLNEFLKEHRKVEQLEKQVEALTTGLQKVSAQLELSKAAPQTVLNGH